MKNNEGKKNGQRFKEFDHFSIGMALIHEDSGTLEAVNEALLAAFPVEIDYDEYALQVENSLLELKNVDEKRPVFLVEMGDEQWLHFRMQEIFDRRDKMIVYAVFSVKALDQIKNNLSFVKEREAFFQNVLDCIHDQIFVIDNNGIILMVNQAVLNAESKYTNLVGRNLQDLVKEGFADEALCFRVLKHKKAEGLLFKEEEGYDLLSWGEPHFKDGEIDFLVCTEWDLDKINYIRDLIEGSKTEKQEALPFSKSKNFINLQIIGESEAMQETLKLAGMVARSDSTVLILGESGVGKEVIMKYIYNNSQRANGPLIEINCGAIPENLIESELFGYEKGAFTGADLKGKKGLFEAAQKGTVFLDEVGELPLFAQAKLLRALQEKEIYRVGGRRPIAIDVRMIAATNKDLKKLVEEKLFREDLYYRLNVLPIPVPSLRERQEDIPLLIEYFMKRYNAKYRKNKSIHPINYDLFFNYKWPGNVRELENILERAFLITKHDQISRMDLMNLFGNTRMLDPTTVPVPELNAESIILKELVDEFEKNLIQSFMPYYKNSRQFAQLLGTDKSSVNRKLKKYGLR